ncbi:MAG: 50S ribosomal protein L5 [Candidatus Omnitrophota bacterium]|nr:50S ribosomal protein L5 [Candidatus Omnitrophota bacterium]
MITPRLLERFRKEIASEMTKIFGYKNLLEVPRLTKIVVNIGLGEATQDIKLLESAQSEIAMITGQKPVVTKAKKAIANFKIRKGSPIGCKVTLRRARMYEFLDRLISVSIPRIRDFRGLSTESFDEGGNYSFGLNEQLIFPEIDADKVMKAHGMDITICTTAKTKKEAFELLRLVGMPFIRPIEGKAPAAEQARLPGKN